MKRTFLAVAAFGVATAANALTVTNSNDGNLLTNAVLGASSGLTIGGGSQVVTGNASQSGTYTGFNLAPSSGSTPTLNLANGIVLSSGTASVSATNTINNTSVQVGTPGLAALTTLSGSNTFDASALTFSFTAAAGQNAVSASFVFGTEEFPTQSVTDIFGFFVDGVNYAKFSDGSLISNAPGGATNFISNPVGAGLYGIEYNGLTNVLTVTGLLDTTLDTHTLTIGLADTSDRIFDSGVYVAGLTGTVTTGGGGIGPTPAIPEPETYALMLAGLCLVGWAARRRKAQA